MSRTSSVVVRPMREDDVEGAARSYVHTFEVLDASEGLPRHAPTPEASGDRGGVPPVV